MWSIYHWNATALPSKTVCNAARIVAASDSNVSQTDHLCEREETGNRIEANLSLRFRLSKRSPVDALARNSSTPSWMYLRVLRGHLAQAPFDIVVRPKVLVPNRELELVGQRLVCVTLHDLKTGFLRRVIQNSFDLHFSAGFDGKL